MSSSKLLDPPYMTKSPGGEKIFTKTRFKEMYNVILPLFENLQDYLAHVHDKYPTICQKLSDYIEEPSFESKDAKISVKLREDGNAYFKSNNLENALEKYTMSIAFAPAESLELAMGYANRSAVFFKTKWMSDCLADIDRALQIGYPDNLKTKLFLRKASCYQALDPKNRGPIDEAFAEARRWLDKINEKNQAAMKQMLEDQEALKPTEKTICYKFDFDVTPPKLEAENPALPGLSDALEMQYSQQFGRQMIALRDIKPGEIIGVQKPYINCIDLEVRYKFCWCCGKQTWSSIPCDGCSEVVYCSEKCRDNAQKAYHDVECYVLRRLLAFGLVNEFITTLRLTIKALKESNNSIETIGNKMKEFDVVKDPMKRGFINGKLDPDNYSSILSLENPKKRSYNKAIHDLVQSLLMAYFLTKKLKLVPSSQDGLNILKKDQSFIFFIQFIENNERLKLRNHYPVYLNTIESGNTKKTSIAITPCFAFFNHSCVQMTVFLFQSQHLVMSTTVPIKKGEQVCVSHGILFIADKKFKRDLILSKLGIKCQCKACNYDWLTLDELFDMRELKSPGIDVYTPYNKSLVNYDLSFKYARENNRIVDYSKERTSASELVEKIYRNSEMNSLKFLMALGILDSYINSSQRPFLNLT